MILLVMRSFLLLTTSIIILALSLPFITIKFINLDRLYQQISEITKIDIANIKSGEAEISVLPTPHLTLKHIKQDNKLELENIKIKFSLFSVILLNPVIQEIVVTDAKLYIDNNISFTTHNEFISQLLAKDILLINTHINRLSVIENNKALVAFANFYLTFSSNIVEFGGQIAQNKMIKGSFTTSGDDTTFIMEANHDNYSIMVEEQYKNKIFTSGKIAAKTKEVPYKIIRLIQDFGLPTWSIKSDKEIDIACDIKSIKNGISLDNIIISSNSIAGDKSIDGNGYINFTTLDKANVEAKFQFNKIDISDWGKIDEDSSFFSSSYDEGGFDFTQNNLLANFTAKEIKLDNNNSLDEVNFNIHTADGKIHIEDFSGFSNKTDKFRINGTVTQNSFRKLFEGSISLTHKDLNDVAGLINLGELRVAAPMPFEASANIKFNSVDLSLQDIVIKTNDAQVGGNLSVKFIGTQPRIISDLHFDFVNLDKPNLPIVGQVFNYGKDLLQCTKEESYLNKLGALRKIQSVSDYDISINKLTVNNKIYDNVNFSLAVAPGRAAIEKLSLRDGKENWIETSFIYEADKLKPALSILINDGVWKVDAISVYALNELRSKILDNFDLNKIDLSISVALRDLYSDKIKLTKLAFALKNDKNLINITKFNANLLGGNIQSSGSILLEPYIMNFVYALNSASLSEISKLLPAGFINSQGAISASGMWSTRGSRVEEQLYNLYTKSELVAKNISFNNFSVDDFVQKVAINNYNISKITDDMNKMLLTGTTEVTDLKTNIELSKGIVALESVIFKTKHTAGTASSSLNLYDFSIDGSAIFSFFLSKPTHERSVSNDPIKMTVTAKGNLFTPKKEADIQALQEKLKQNQQ